MSVSQKVYKCMIVDDDDIDRLTIQSFARQYPFLEIVGAFSSSTEALEAAQGNPPDVLLLDIDIPDLSGLELRKKLEHIPACIFVTAHPEYALESFETTALDFLVKPLKADRFATAMGRLQQYLDTLYKAELLDHTLGGDSLFIKDGHDHIKLQLHEIIYLEALKDYTGIVTPKKKYCVLSPIGQLLGEKAFGKFIRIHRSYAVQKHFVSRITAREVFINNISLPIGRSYKDALNDLKPG